MPNTDPHSAALTDDSNMNTPNTPTLDLPTDLKQLAAAIGQLPADQSASLQPLVDRVIESTSRRRRILSLVQDALGQLRLDMKYLMFDLEATRRERDACQRQLEQITGEADDFE